MSIMRWFSALIFVALLAQTALAQSNVQITAIHSLSGGAGSPDGTGPYWGGNGRQQLTANLTLQNFGPSQSGSISLHLYFCSTTVWDPNSYYLSTAVWLAINGNQSTGPINVPFTINPTAILEGSYYVFVRVEDSWGPDMNAMWSADTAAWSENKFRLRFASAGAGNGSINVWIASGSSGQVFLFGSNNINIDATPAAGSTFTNWTLTPTGTIGNSSSPNTWINITKNSQLTGTFGLAPTPSISASPTSLAFSGTANGSNPTSKTIALNVTNGPVSWSATDNAAWLSLSPTSGTTSTTITASVNIAGLAAGTHTATITITAAGANGSPLSVPVTLTLSPTAGVLVWAPPNHDFGSVAIASNATKSLQLTNTGGSTVSGTIGVAGSGYLILSGGGAFTLTPSATLNVLVQFSPQLLGFFSGTLSATGANAPAVSLIGNGVAALAPTISAPVNSDAYIAQDWTLPLQGLIMSDSLLNTVTVVVQKHGGAPNSTTLRRTNVNALSFNLAMLGPFDARQFSPTPIVLNRYTLGVWASSASFPNGVLLHSFDVVYSDQRSLSQYNATLKLPFETTYEITQYEDGWISHQSTFLDTRAIDFATPQGTPILAPCDLIITKIETNRNAAYGLHIVGESAIDSRLSMLFAHLDSLNGDLIVDDHIPTGYPLGTSGNTPGTYAGNSMGYHLHFRLWDHTTGQPVRILPFDGHIVLGEGDRPTSTNVQIGAMGGESHGGNCGALPSRPGTLNSFGILLALFSVCVLIRIRHGRNSRAIYR